MMGMLLKNKILKANNDLLNLKIVFGYKNIIASIFIIFVSDLIGVISYFQNENFWTVIYNILTNQLHYLLLFSVIVYNIIYISSKLKNYLFMSRYKNYNVFLKILLKNILLFITLLLIISFSFILILSMIRSNFNFAIINHEYYNILLPFYLIIFVLREAIIIYLISIIIFYICNQNFNKILSLMIMIAIPSINMFTYQSKIINDIFQLPIIYSYYLIKLPCSNIFLEISGSLFQLFLLSFIIVLLKNHNIKGDL